VVEQFRKRAATYYTATGVELLKNVLKDVPRKKKKLYVNFDLPDGVTEAMSK
jgi:hypothetical protein